MFTTALSNSVKVTRLL